MAGDIKSTTEQQKFEHGKAEFTNYKGGGLAATYTLDNDGVVAGVAAFRDGVQCSVTRQGQRIHFFETVYLSDSSIEPQGDAAFKKLAAHGAGLTAVYDKQDKHLAGIRKPAEPVNRWNPLQWMFNSRDIEREDSDQYYGVNTPKQVQAVAQAMKDSGVTNCKGPDGKPYSGPIYLTPKDVRSIALTGTGSPRVFGK